MADEEVLDEAFYNMPEQQKASRSSHLISTEKYILTLLQTKEQKRSHCLHWLCNGSHKAVPMYENVFDIILEGHSKGGHTKYCSAVFFKQNFWNIKYCFM